MSFWSWLFGTKPEDPQVDNVELAKTGAIVVGLGAVVYYLKKKIDSMFSED